jgi:hypothetical protein
MTLARTFGTVSQERIAKSASAVFDRSAIYRFCIAFALLDFMDILNVVDFTPLGTGIKYSYALIMLGFMFLCMVRWRTVDTTTLAPVIILLFFLVTGLAFAWNFIVHDQRQSYISAFIAPLVFSLAIFIPPNSFVVDARRITRGLTLLFSVGCAFYLVEAIVKPLELVNNIVFLHEVQFIKSIIFVLALSLSILTGQKVLGLFLAILTITALALRPTSTLVLALICCMPLAAMLRLRVIKVQPVAVSISRAGAMIILMLAAIIPMLLYFFFDEMGALIDLVESYVKVDVLGGQSNTAFRLTILKYAFASIDNTSFLYGSALAGDLNVLIAQEHAWWLDVNKDGLVPIHSDFVIVFVLMGIIGYVVFTTMFYLILKVRFRELARRDVHDSEVVLHSLAVVAVVALVIYISGDPFLSYFNHAHVVWMLLLISEIVRKDRHTEA